MPEYIEREALIKDIDETVVFTVRDGTHLPTSEMRGANKVIDRIKSAPTADVVEVVRCCDCEHKQENPDINNTCYLTCNLKYGIGGTIDPTDFCSYGKRKEVKNA